MTPFWVSVAALIQSIEVCANPQTLLTIAPHNIQDKVRLLFEGNLYKEVKTLRVVVNW